MPTTWAARLGRAPTSLGKAVDRDCEELAGLDALDRASQVLERVTVSGISVPSCSSFACWYPVPPVNARIAVASTSSRA
jgi:hypothetical protein